MTLNSVTASGRLDRGEAGGQIAPVSDNDRMVATLDLRAGGPVPPSSQSGRLARIARWIWFVVVVIVPSVSAIIYYGFIASDQYISQFRCVVQSGDPARSVEGGLAAPSSNAGASLLALNSNIVVQYIKSPTLFDALGKQLDWKKIYASPSVDFLSRLPSDASEEEKEKYWGEHVTPFFDQTTGTISVSVRAFTPDDALAISSGIIKLADALMNGVTRRLRGDAVMAADEDVARAASRVQETREKIFQARIMDARIDPVKESASDIALIGKLRDSLAQSEAQLSTYLSMASDSPIVRILKTRIAVLKSQIAATQRALVAPSSGGAVEKSVNGSLRDFEALQSQLDLDEKYYGATLNSLELARSTAERQATYLSVFVQPNLPEMATYPKRGESVLLIVLASLGVWILSLIMYHSVREHI